MVLQKWSLQSISKQEKLLSPFKQFGEGGPPLGETMVWVRCFYKIKEWFNAESVPVFTLCMDFFRPLYSQSIFSPPNSSRGDSSNSPPFSFLVHIGQFTVFDQITITYFNVIVFPFNIWFSFSVFVHMTDVGISTLERHTFHNRNHTNACVIVPKLQRDLYESLFYSVYVIVKGVCWWERNGFTRRRPVFICLQLCSLRGCTSRQGLSSRCILSSWTYFRGRFRGNDTCKNRGLKTSSSK